MPQQKVPTQDQRFRLLLFNLHLIQELIHMFLTKFPAIPIDPGSLHDWSTEVVSPKTGQERRTDIVVRWTCKGVPWALLLEHQSSPDSNMTYRMLNYVVLLYGRMFNDRSFVTAEGSMAVLLPVVFYTGKRKWKFVTNFIDCLVSLSAELSQHLPQLQIILIDLHRLDKAWLAQQKGVLAAIIRCERSVGVEQMDVQVATLAEALAKVNDLQLNETVLQHIVWLLMDRKYGSEVDYSKLENMNTMVQVKGQLEQWVVEDRKRRHLASFCQGRTHGRTEGRTEGRAEGIAEGMKRLLKNQLEIKFGARTNGLYLEFLDQHLSEKQYQQLSRLILECNTWEELMLKYYQDKK